MKSILLILSICLSSFVSAQEIQPDEKRVLGDTLIFLGIDFSTAKFENPGKTDKSEYIRDRHGAVWGKIDDLIAQRFNLKYDFQKKVVVAMTALFDESYKRVDSNWVVEQYEGMADEQVKEHIRKYPEFATHGLGLVMLVDKMDMRKQTLGVCAVYINLQSNEVIKILRAEGGIGGGFGYTAYFNTALENAYHDMISKNDKYLKTLRKYFGKKG